MTIYYLYVKPHNKTGLKYLGYTGRENPYEYPGSGLYWGEHLNKHGYDFTTEILKECSTKNEIKHWGLYYSNLWNIVEDRDTEGNKTWANLKLESGDGGDMSMCENFKRYTSGMSEKCKLRKWWNNGSKQVHSESPPDDTYSPGRLSFNNRGSAIGAIKQRGKIWINNGVNEMMVYDIDVPDGYVEGRLPSPKKNKPNVHASGTKWWHNGTKSVMSINCPGEDWTSGRILKRRVQRTSD